MSRRTLVISSIVLVTVVAVAAVLVVPRLLERPTPPPQARPGGLPSEANTGVPPGTELDAMPGDLVIDEPGMVIDAKQITGNVSISARDVRITRSRIAGGGSGIVVRTTATGSVTIEDTEITGGGDGEPIVCCSSYTLRRVNIHSTTEGPRLGDNTLVEETYIHHLRRCPDCHIDALQSTAGTNIVVRRSNLQAFNPDLDDPMNAAFQFGESTGPIRNCLFEDNVLNGGNYTVNGGGGGTRGAACTFRGNTFGPDYRYGPWGNLGDKVALDEASNIVP